jgi:hypothetical protein
LIPAHLAKVAVGAGKVEVVMKSAFKKALQQGKKSKKKRKKSRNDSDSDDEEDDDDLYALMTKVMKTSAMIKPCLPQVCPNMATALHKNDVIGIDTDTAMSVTTSGDRIVGKDDSASAKAKFTMTGIGGGKGVSGGIGLMIQPLRESVRLFDCDYRPARQAQEVEAQEGFQAEEGFQAG